MVERNSKANVRRCSILITFPGVVTQAASKPTKCLGSEATLLRRGRNDINLGIYLLIWDEKEKEGGKREEGRTRKRGRRRREGRRGRKKEEKEEEEESTGQEGRLMWMAMAFSFFISRKYT